MDRNELFKSAHKKGFVNKFIYEKPYNSPIPLTSFDQKEDLRYYLHLQEMNYWLSNKTELISELEKEIKNKLENGKL